MKTPLFGGFDLVVNMPFRLVRSQSQYDLTLYLPEPCLLASETAPEGFAIDEFDDNSDYLSLHSLYLRCGFQFSHADFDHALSLCIPEGVRTVRSLKSNEIVSVMMARHLATSDFPYGGRIDWLATDPAYRGHGLGRLAASLATSRLIERCYKKIWVTTQPHRLGAIRIFTKLGFQPTDRTISEYDWVAIKAAVDARG